MGYSPWGQKESLGVENTHIHILRAEPPSSEQKYQSRDRHTQHSHRHLIQILPLTHTHTHTTRCTRRHIRMEVSPHLFPFLHMNVCPPRPLEGTVLSVHALRWLDTEMSSETPMHSTRALRSDTHTHIHAHTQAHSDACPQPLNSFCWFHFQTVTPLIFSVSLTHSPTPTFGTQIVNVPVLRPSKHLTLGSKGPAL